MKSLTRLALQVLLAALLLPCNAETNYISSGIGNMFINIPNLPEELKTRQDARSYFECKKKIYQIRSGAETGKKLD
jgi:hypothetical protein